VSILLIIRFPASLTHSNPLTSEAINQSYRSLLLGSTCYILTELPPLSSQYQSINSTVLPFKQSPFSKPHFLLPSQPLPFQEPCTTPFTARQITSVSKTHASLFFRFHDERNSITSRFTNLQESIFSARLIFSFISI
jgi:hypothetical protein